MGWAISQFLEVSSETPGGYDLLDRCVNGPKEACGVKLTEPYIILNPIILYYTIV